MAFYRLIGMLDESLQLYRDLAELELQKRDVLVKGSMEELQHLNGQVAAVMDQIGELDQQRIQTLLELQQERAIQSDAGMTLTALIACLDAEEEQQALRTVQQIMSETTRMLKSIGERNQLLIEQSLAYVEDTVQTMAGAAEHDYVYQNPKVQQGSTNRTTGFDIRT